MRQGKRHITHYTYDSTHQLVSASNPQTYTLNVTYGPWGKIQEYGLSQTDLANNVTTSQTRYYSYGSLNEGQTTFAPNNISYADGTNVNEQYGIGGSLQRRETNIPGNPPSEELYRFGADGNLRMYSYDRLFYSLYGYDGGTTRTYKYSFDLNPNWVNGRLEAVNFNPHTAMFYPNSYLNFNQDGYYTKHYYNGMERIASRLGDQNLQIHTNDPELQDRKDWQDSLIRKNVTEITGYDFLPVGEEQNPEDPKPVFELPQVGITGLQPIGSGDVYYYHPNHLGSTCYVTDGNASVQQGFLYAPFGEITNEYNSGWQNGVLPKYSFNAKELDEETGMYYYEARYYAPPVFTSRDPLFEKYPTFSPYAYCANNPVKFIDPTGMELVLTGELEDINSFIKIINSFFDFSSELFILNNGVVRKNDEISEKELDNMSGAQKAFYNTMMSAIENKKVISIDIVNKVGNVLFGAWETGQIDIADMIALGTGEGSNMYSVIGHEIAEQQYKQTTENPNGLRGHFYYGIPAENSISGYYRLKDQISDNGNIITIRQSNYEKVISISLKLSDEGHIESVNREIIIIK